MTKKAQIPTVATDEEQLSNWVEGRCYHWQLSARIVNCCPDFSCCNPSLLQPVEVRRAFVAADSRKRGKFLMAFLEGLISKQAPDLRVYITDGFPEGQS